MARTAKKFLITAAVVLLVFVFLPFFSLVAPGRLRDYMYRTYFFLVVSEQVAAGAADPVLVTERTLDFIYSNTFNVFRELTVDGTPLADLSRGSTRCDQAANALAQLLSFQQVDAALMFLQDHHTVSRVRLKGAWYITDPHWGVIFRDRAGNFATLKEIHEQNERFSSRRVNGMSRVQIEQYLGYFGSEKPKKVWNPPMGKLKGVRKFFRETIVFYHKRFGIGYFYLFQDGYLAVARRLEQEKIDLRDADARLYFRARNYQLTGRNGKAHRLYNRLVEEYPESFYRDKSRIFAQAAAMKLGAWGQARQALEDFLEENGDSPWADPARFYLSWCLHRLGRQDLPAEASDVSGGAYYFRRDR